MNKTFSIYYCYNFNICIPDCSIAHSLRYHMDHPVFCIVDTAFDIYVIVFVLCLDITKAHPTMHKTGCDHFSILCLQIPTDPPQPFHSPTPGRASPASFSIIVSRGFIDWNNNAAASSSLSPNEQTNTQIGTFSIVPWTPSSGLNSSRDNRRVVIVAKTALGIIAQQHIPMKYGWK